MPHGMENRKLDWSTINNSLDHCTALLVLGKSLCEFLVNVGQIQGVVEHAFAEKNVVYALGGMVDKIVVVQI